MSHHLGTKEEGMREGKRNFTLLVKLPSYYKKNSQRSPGATGSNCIIGSYGGDSLFPSFLHQVWTNRNRRKGLLLQSTDAKPTSFYFFDEKVDQSRNDESSPDVTIANASRAPPP